MDATIFSPQLAGAQGRSAPSEFSAAHAHLLGIGGSGMAGLAAVLLRHGARVSGSDASHSPVIDRLIAAGAEIHADDDASVLPEGITCVVASAAIPENHPAVRAARQRGMRIYKYAEALGELMRNYVGVAVAGTHGKSTTTAWLTHILRTAGLDPNFVVGAHVEQLGGSSGVGDGRHFVAEACEYDRSFLNFSPHFAAILNVDEDHLDYYHDMSQIRAAFREFAQRVPHGGRLLYDGDDPNLATLGRDLTCEVETFGFGTANHWRPMYLKLRDGCYEFELIHRDEKLLRARLLLSGRHNVWNAVAAAA
ncbi:MAG: UDP-N-acetylmuramate--L-alanine ligase, partial [Planctomycetota bacterium]